MAVSTIPIKTPRSLGSISSGGEVAVDLTECDTVYVCPLLNGVTVSCPFVMPAKVLSRDGNSKTFFIYQATTYNLSGSIKYSNGKISYTQNSITGWTSSKVEILVS